MGKWKESEKEKRKWERYDLQNEEKEVKKRDEEERKMR